MRQVNPEWYYGWDKEPEEPEGEPDPEPEREPIFAINTREEFDEMFTAIEEGRACRLMSCYLCPGPPWPQRGLVRTNLVQKLFDPTETYTLTCGHTIT